MRRRIKIFLRKPWRSKIILDEAKKNKQIIYGARSIQQHLGTISRQTKDYDIFTKNSKKAASRTEKKLDKDIGFDYFYTKKGMNPGTWKVKGKGYDLKKENEDDEGIVDYTNMPKPIPKSKLYNGVKYRILSLESAAKRRALADKEYKYRHEKDRKDLELIKSVIRVSRIARPKFPKIKRLF